MDKIILFNPRSAKTKHRIPNSKLQIRVANESKYDYVFVDGNLENNPLEKIKGYFNSGNFAFPELLDALENNKPLEPIKNFEKQSRI